MTDDEMKLQARILAIEFVLCQTYSMVLAMQGQSEQEISALEYRGMLNMDQQASEIGVHELSGHEPAAFLSAFQDAIVSLQSQARDLRESLRARLYP